MTNREWLNGLDNNKYAEVIRAYGESAFCLIIGNALCNARPHAECDKCIERWLAAEANAENNTIIKNGW